MSFIKVKLLFKFENADLIMHSIIFMTCYMKNNIKMFVEAFLEKMTKIQKSILEYIENEDDEEENFLILVELFTKLKISEDPIIL